MAWLHHSPAPRLPFTASLLDSVCLALLPLAVLVRLMAESTAEGGDVTAIQAAMDLQNDPSRPMELDQTVVAVDCNNGAIYRVDTTSVAVTAVAGVAPLPGLQGYGEDKLSLQDQVWTPVAPLPSGRQYARAVVQNCKRLL